MSSCFSINSIMDEDLQFSSDPQINGHQLTASTPRRGANPHFTTYRNRGPFPNRPILSDVLSSPLVSRKISRPDYQNPAHSTLLAPYPETFLNLSVVDSYEHSARNAGSGTQISTSPPPTASFSVPSDLSLPSSAHHRFPLPNDSLRKDVETEPVSPGQILDLRIDKTKKKLQQEKQSFDSQRHTPDSYLRPDPIIMPTKLTSRTNHHSIVLSNDQQWTQSLTDQENCIQHAHQQSGMMPYSADTFSFWLAALQQYQWQQYYNQSMGTPEIPTVHNNNTLMDPTHTLLAPINRSSMNPQTQTDLPQPRPLGINQSLNRMMPINQMPSRMPENDGDSRKMEPVLESDHCLAFEKHCPLRGHDPNTEETEEAESLSKGPAILYYPEPHDSREQIRTMLEKRDPRLKFVNDGAAILNPFAVDRRIQLAHLTATLCVRTETGLYMCKGCDRKTNRFRPMQQHLLSHSASKFNLCTRCLKGFNDKYDMKRHTRKHTMVRPYTCPECDRAFSQRCSLEGHRRKIHQVRFQYHRNQRREVVRVCETCGFACPTVAKMLQHTLVQHPTSTSLPRLRRQTQRQAEQARRSNGPLRRGNRSVHMDSTLSTTLSSCEPSVNNRDAMEREHVGMAFNAYTLKNQ